MTTKKMVSLCLHFINKTMLLPTWLAIGFTMISAAPCAAAGDGATLVRERHCYGCHHLSKPLIGPAYTAIAARHRARKEVMVDVLAHKIIAGGAGNWGVVPMVPNEQVSEDEARIIARWILELGK